MLEVSWTGWQTKEMEIKECMCLCVRRSRGHPLAESGKWDERRKLLSGSTGDVGQRRFWPISATAMINVLEKAQDSRGGGLESLDEGKLLALLLGGEFLTLIRPGASSPAWDTVPQGCMRLQR